VSSSDSGSQFAPSSDHSLEVQLKVLPLIHDILDRLVRCEYSTREIQRDLGDVHRKVNLPVEHSLSNPSMNSQSEFKDPFALSSANSQSFNSTPLNGAQGSMGGIAPNLVKSWNDSTLTTSVGQLLALLTHQHIQPTNSGLPNGQVGGNHNHNQQQQDLAPNQCSRLRCGLACWATDCPIVRT
jgi:hypothetical protein